MNVAAFIISAVVWVFAIWGSFVFLSSRFKYLQSSPEFWFSVLMLCVGVPLLAILSLGVLPQNWAKNLSLYEAATAFQSIELAGAKHYASLKPMLLVIYVIGVLILLARIAIPYAALIKLSKQKPAKHYKNTPLIFVNVYIPPCSFGLYKPVIIIPKILASRLSTEQLQMIYAHEHAHIQYQDQRVYLGFLVLRALTWPHPVIQDLINRWRAASEVRADSLALVGRTHDQRKIYGKILLDVLRKKSGGTLPCPSATLHLSQYRSAKMRVNNIMNPSVNEIKTRNLGKKMSLMFLAVLIGGTGAMTAFAGQVESPDKNAQPLKRYPPIFPVNCPLNEGKYAAKVSVVFDVSKQGRVKNARITKSDNPCFNTVTLKSTKKWIYAQNSRRLKNVEAMIVYKASQ